MSDDYTRRVMERMRRASMSDEERLEAYKQEMNRWAGEVIEWFKCVEANPDGEHPARPMPDDSMLTRGDGTRLSHKLIFREVAMPAINQAGQMMKAQRAERQAAWNREARADGESYDER